MANRLPAGPTHLGMASLNLRSGYGLCGFFIAGNEHVLIGTKVRRHSETVKKVWKRQGDEGEAFLFICSNDFIFI